MFYKAIKVQNLLPKVPKTSSVKLRLVVELCHMTCIAVKVTFLTWNRFKGPMLYNWA